MEKEEVLEIRLGDSQIKQDKSAKLHPQHPNHQAELLHDKKNKRSKSGIEHNPKSFLVPEW